MQLLPSCGFFICVPRHDVVMERESDEDGTQDMKQDNEETRWLCQICFLHPSLYIRQLNSIVGQFVLTLVLIRLLVHHSAFTPWQLLGFCAQRERERQTDRVMLFEIQELCQFLQPRMNQHTVSQNRNTHSFSCQESKHLES